VYLREIEMTLHPIKDLLSLHEQRFVERYGTKPAKYTGRDAKHAQIVINTFGEERAKQLLEHFFATEDKFISESGHSMGIFASSTVLNKLIAELSQSQRKARNDGREWAREFIRGK
jgi:hypothetical protein